MLEHRIFSTVIVVLQTQLSSVRVFGGRRIETSSCKCRSPPMVFAVGWW